MVKHHFAFEVLGTLSKHSTQYCLQDTMNKVGMGIFPPARAYHAQGGLSMSTDSLQIATLIVTLPDYVLYDSRTLD
jgi:hypothetical protein